MIQGTPSGYPLEHSKLLVEPVISEISFFEHKRSRPLGAHAFLRLPESGIQTSYAVVVGKV